MNKLLAVLMSGLFVLSVSAFADDTAADHAAKKEAWEKAHPRRAEVNQRLANQNKRIHNEVKEGDLTKQQAAKLHEEDKDIRSEEKNMSEMDNGHITKTDQRALNQQENAVSKQIGK
jgi:hypothetical protein